MDIGREMYFSQAALATYQACPLKFRYRYLDKLNWLHAGKHDLREAERVRGEQFHLLAQRYFQQVELPHLFRLAPPGPLKEWLECLQRRFPLQQDLAYYPEQELRIELDDVRLTVKYDLLAVKPDGRIIIYDWKTWTAAPSKQVRTLQTQIYSMVLCAAQPFGPIRPDDITMIFWNPRFPQDEQVWQYNELLYSQDRAEITALINNIMDIHDHDFPGIKSAEAGSVSKECKQCDYAALCFNAAMPGIGDALLPEKSEFSWDEIEEIFYEEA